MRSATICMHKLRWLVLAGVAMTGTLAVPAMLGSCAHEPESDWLVGGIPEQLREHACDVLWLVSPGSLGDLVEISPASRTGDYVNEIHIDNFNCHIGSITINNSGDIIVWGIPSVLPDSSPAGLYQVDLEQKHAVIVAEQGPRNGILADGSVLGLYSFVQGDLDRMAIISERRFTVIDGATFDVVKSTELPWSALRWSHMGDGKFLGSDTIGYGQQISNNRIRSMFVDASIEEIIAITEFDAPWGVASKSDLRNAIVAHDKGAWYVWSYGDSEPGLYKIKQFMLEAPIWLNMQSFQSCAGSIVMAQSHDIPYGTTWTVGNSVLSTLGFTVYDVIELCKCGDVE